MSISNLAAESIWQEIESTHSVADDHLSTTDCILFLGRILERATRILDQGGVKRISGEPSGRSIFQENRGRRRNIYASRHTIVPAIHSSMTSSIEGKSSCKHQLAARLAASTGTCVDIKVFDEELALLLSNRGFGLGAGAHKNGKRQRRHS